MQSRRSPVGKLARSLVILAIVGQCLSVAVETPEPASLLRPRDVNPHPYRNPYEGIAIFDRNLATNSEKFSQNLLNQGPVQFPRVRDGSAVNELAYPYEALALKERQQKMGRFAGADSPIVKPAYQALAKHAARLLGKGYQVDDIDFLNEAATDVKKNYVFSYAVKDTASGDDFSHTQQQQMDGAVKGSYKVQLPDGRMQIVKYIADNNGYRADVTYENEPVAAVQPVPVVSPSTPAAYGYYQMAAVGQQQQQQQQQHQQQYIINQQQRQLYYPATQSQIPAPFYPAQLRPGDVKIHSYNTAPHAGSVIASTTTQATPASEGGTYLATFPAPANLAYIATPSSSSPITGTVLTTGAPLPAYRDIHVPPPAPVQPIGVAFASAGRRTTVYTGTGPRNTLPAGPVRLQQTVYHQVQPTFIADAGQGGVTGASNLNYIQGYVQIPTNENRVYRRNTDRSTEVLPNGHGQRSLDHDLSKKSQTKRHEQLQKASSVSA
ncbi:uncharacterized protein LOC125953542 [Anopheles darlingi]|uniref:uncharacterized protein LOC125953542 n=1 Tax=Anopheles darlingi TaxID=43151 RepID=UPI0021005808|nr:uncharacterized protein LOC125953542 [Anopheles darlingi]